MSLAWYFRIADRTHPLLIPTVYVSCSAAVFGAAFAVTSTGFVYAATTRLQLVGTLALFILLPAYFLAMAIHQRRRTLATLDDLAAVARTADADRVRACVDRLPGFAWIGGLLGFGFGVMQNPEILHGMLCSGRYAPMDVAFVLGACLVWTLVALVLCWRLPTSIAISRLGRHLDVDLYRLDRVRPLGRLATTDVLVIAGALAFMPLQSLDAEFRAGNYQPGLLIGLPAAAAFFLIPVWGVHRRIRSVKAARIEALRARLHGADRDDIGTLETLTAHLDRIAALPTWPVDVRLLTRLFAYGIIPPLAWIGAALVEGWVAAL